MKYESVELIAVEVKVADQTVWVRLLDGSTHSFPVAYYPNLARGSDAELSEARLRVGGRALRWEALDEDIWIADAVLGRYPTSAAAVLAVNENAQRK
jgi:hypothetical protein